MNPYLEILRPANAMMAIIAVVLIAIIGYNYNTFLFSYYIPIGLGILAVFLATGAGNAINDYFDHEIDAINRPDRPIPSGRISLKNAKTYAVILFIIAIILGIAIGVIINNYLPLIIVLFNSILMYLYAYYFKSTVLFGNIIIAYLTASCFIFGGIIINLVEIAIYLGCFAFLMTLAREIVKDIEDIEGDAEGGATTLPIKYGTKLSSILSSIFILVPTIFSPVLYFIGIFNIFYLIPLAIAILIFLFASYRILGSQDSKTCGEVSKLIKIGMFISFVAFAIGSISF
ncbi:UbiA family prenyltransferase [Methanobrevibacter filiformis]|uniref:Digeranylgeranylglyceryl phosphate synthase n=1 Tax=Methanobrevibacter filiformis TaxID=55758 RepID=A0A166BYW0_9EURY|nr:UbiA family prenyltransferase [Methanobrevibacter filiformis]KZX09877.1 protoheme IX farnesyltransferase [Methanobrevibacter filiformis]